MSPQLPAGTTWHVNRRPDVIAHPGDACIPFIDYSGNGHDGCYGIFRDPDASPGTCPDGFLAFSDEENLGSPFGGNSGAVAFTTSFSCFGEARPPEEVFDLVDHLRSDFTIEFWEKSYPRGYTYTAADGIRDGDPARLASWLKLSLNEVLDANHFPPSGQEYFYITGYNGWRPSSPVSPGYPATGSPSWTNGSVDQNYRYLNAWHHFVWRVSGNTETMFHQGVQLSDRTGGSSQTITQDRSGQITEWGFGGGGNGEPLNTLVIPGNKMTEIAIYDYPLSSGRIAAHHSAGSVASYRSAVQADGPVAHYYMNDSRS